MQSDLSVNTYTFVRNLSPKSYGAPVLAPDYNTTGLAAKMRDKLPMSILCLLDTYTVFHVASVTKAWTTTIVYVFVESMAVNIASVNVLMQAEWPVTCQGCYIKETF